MYEELLAYDTVCKSIVKKKQQIISDLENSDLAREILMLRSDLNGLTAKKKQITADLEKFNAELASVIEKYNECLRDYQDEAEDFKRMENDPEIQSDEFAECRKELEKLSVTLKKLAQQAEKIAQTADKLAKDLVSVTSEGQKKAKRYKAAQAEFETEKENRKAELLPLEAEKAEAGKAVDPALRSQYDRIAESHPDPIASPVNGRCSGCKMALPSSMASKVNAGQIVICENCGRMIIRG